MEPEFSVILPVYNAQETIGRTIDCLLSQTFNNYEILVIDDGSTDDSGRILDQYAVRDNRVRVLHKENGGANSARNLALKYIRGRYVTFCDADDWAEPNWLLSFDEHIVGNDVVVQGWTYVTKTERILQIYEEEPTSAADAVDVMSSHESFGFLWNKCFRTSIIQKNSLSFNEHFSFLEDEEFICRYWVFVRKVFFSNVAAYQYNMPDFDSKYRSVDNFYLYVSLLNNASLFIKSSDSITMQKYCMGLFRNMMLTFQQRNYVEGIHRLRKFSQYGKSYKVYNKYMRIIRPWNWPMWIPVLMIRGLI